ncbi:CHC2 zinc finger domain-containing protein [Sulfuriroseicoccus oceanibius]|uniref:Zinc finger CHC2-type domain-containing protein n=1 Tax=Sulfuriroseicoccus oceanibius TaxID=2707525 RepID=A0A6B3L915_9BACT|nr:CHC2 zinc finger domain-containing protein [Sulfuriroseicoccus oceanibius]QQL43708.1 hypothetical protein G3M56_007290 [Sulfuriroseicoccus oceanibius]
MKISDAADRRKETIKSRVRDVLDALRIETHDRGAYVMFRCPCLEHDDNTPSAVLYRNAQYVECFGCGWRGDALDVIALKRGLDVQVEFPEVLDEGAQLLDLPSSPRDSGAISSKDRETKRKERRAKKEHRQRAIERAKQEVDRIIEASGDSNLSYDEMAKALVDASPIPVPDSEASESAAHLMVRTLFAGKRIWLGRFSSDGIPKGRIVDVTEDSLVCELQAAKAKGNDLRLTPSTYLCMQDHRRGENVHEQCYAVLEMDELRGRKPESADEIEELKCRCLILIKWLTEHGVIRPVAVVDTGNKSLHVWIEAPSEDRAQDVLDQVDAMGFDLRSYKNKVGPFRLPGCVHSETKREARLLWLAPPSGGTEAVETGSTCENQ